MKGGKTEKISFLNREVMSRYHCTNEVPSPIISLLHSSRRKLPYSKLSIKLTSSQTESNLVKE
jgi:hypothetical protein